MCQSMDPFYQCDLCKSEHQVRGGRVVLHSALLRGTLPQRILTKKTKDVLLAGQGTELNRGQGRVGGGRGGRLVYN